MSVSGGGGGEAACRIESFDICGAAVVEGDARGDGGAGEGEVSVRDRASRSRVAEAFTGQAEGDSESNCVTFADIIADRHGQAVYDILLGRVGLLVNFSQQSKESVPQAEGKGVQAAIETAFT